MSAEQLLFFSCTFSMNRGTLRVNISFPHFFAMEIGKYCLAHKQQYSIYLNSNFHSFKTKIPLANCRGSHFDLQNGKTVRKTLHKCMLLYVFHIVLWGEMSLVSFFLYCVKMKESQQQVNESILKCNFEHCIYFLIILGCRQQYVNL